MEKFYEMQQDENGIVGPEGPGWPRISPMVPVAVREHFLDHKAQPDKSGTLFPQARTPRPIPLGHRLPRAETKLEDSSGYMLVVADDGVFVFEAFGVE